MKNYTWNIYSLSPNYMIDDKFRDFEYTFTINNETDFNAYMVFNIGHMPGAFISTDLILDDIELYEHL